MIKKGRRKIDLDPTELLIEKLSKKVIFGQESLDKNINLGFYNLTTDIQATEEFKKKGLADLALNCGIKCGHGCTYCYVPALLRRHPVIKRMEDPFALNIEIIDPSVVDRLDKEASKYSNSSDKVLMLCTQTDLFTDNQVKHEVPEKVLKIILEKTNLKVRIVTKNKNITNYVELLKKFGDRITVGLSIGMLNDTISKILEPNASLHSERMDAYKILKQKGIRVFGMLCPIFPGVADTSKQTKKFMDNFKKYKFEEIWIEPLNIRSKNLAISYEKLTEAGELTFLNHLKNVFDSDDKNSVSNYIFKVYSNTMSYLKANKYVKPVHYLIYTKSVIVKMEQKIKKDAEKYTNCNIHWLGKPR